MSNLNHTYYNALIVCDKTNVNSNDFQAEFEDTTSQAIVNQTGNYQFAIERFSMEGHNIPIWIPNISSGNTTTYSIKLNVILQGNNAKIFTSDEIFLQYVPKNIFNSGDPAYYFVYNYDNFVEMLNNAFVSAMANLQTKINNYTLLTNPPFIVYDGAVNLFSIYFDEQGFFTQTANENITLTFNNDLYNLLKTFYFKTNINGNNFKDIVIVNKGNNYFSGMNNLQNPVSATKVNYCLMSQMQPSTNNCWSPVQSILFSSDSISLKPEIIGNASILGNNSQLGSGNSNNSQSMITDLVLDISRSSDYLDMLVYQPAMHRWIDLSDSQYLKNFRFSIWWLNKYNQQRYPILLANNGCVTLKVLFEKL